MSSMIMIKDNHVKVAGGIANAVSRVKQAADFTSKIEVETSSLDQALEALESGVDVIMLDNMNPEQLEKVSRQLKKISPMVLIEASGGITAENVANFCLPDVDIISMSCLIQGYPTVDFSMKISNN